MTSAMLTMEHIERLNRRIVELEMELVPLKAIERRWNAVIKHSWRIVQYGPHFVVLPIEGDSVGDGLSAESAVDDAIEKAEGK